QDKLLMRAACDRLGLPNPAWAAVSTVAELIEFGERLGWPVVLKTPRGGDDGRGVRVVRSAAEAESCAAWIELVSPSASEALLAEEMVDFSRELSAQVARTPSGQTAAYPVVESIQTDGVCDVVTAPAPGLDAGTARAAQAAAVALAE